MSFMYKGALSYLLGIESGSLEPIIIRKSNDGIKWVFPVFLSSQESLGESLRQERDQHLLTLDPELSKRPFTREVGDDLPHEEQMR